MPLYSLNGKFYVMHILPQLEKKLVLPKQFNSIFLDGKILLFKKPLK